MPKRILTSQIDSNYADGDILYGSDINKIIDVFTDGINADKSDVEKVLVGIATTYVANTKPGLDAYLSEYVPAEGQLGFVMNGDDSDSSLQIYKYQTVGSLWVYVDTISIG